MFYYYYYYYYHYYYCFIIITIIFIISSNIGIISIISSITLYINWAIKPFDHLLIPTKIVPKNPHYPYKTCPQNQYFKGYQKWSLKGPEIFLQQHKINALIPYQKWSLQVA